MAELALSILGVVPTIVQAVAACRKIHKGIKTARKCVEHLGTISIDWKIQQGRFLNECVLLLVESGEEEIVGRAMVKDPTHVGWTKTSLGPAFEKCLGESYGLCQKIIERIEGILLKVKTMMACFDVAKKQKMKGESLKVSFQRILQGLRFPFNKDDLEKQIGLMREKNGDLESLRGQMERFRRNTSSRSGESQSETMPKYYCELQQISAEAHGALTSSFSCSDASHDEHTLSIELDVEYCEEVRLNMALTYLTRCSSSVQKDPPIKFFMQSKYLSQSSNDSGSDLVPSSRGGECRKGKRKCSVAFTDLLITPKRPSTVQMDDDRQKRFDKEAQIAGPSIDLAAISSACEFLRKTCCRPEKPRIMSAQVASLRQSDMARYIFYVSSVAHDFSTPFSGYMMATPSMSLPEFLRAQLQETLSVVQQYKLALKLTKAVLQFHSTPWFEEEWSTRQLYVMPGPNGSEEEVPVYINSKLPSTNSATPAGLVDTEGAIGGKQALSGAKKPLSSAQRRGVYNISLFCLGIALLEIAHWKPLDSLREDRYDEDDIDTARRMANGNSVLGKWYDEVIRKCLRCDFGFGSDLKKVELQRAVYRDVICPLDDLIERMNGLTLLVRQPSTDTNMK